MDRSSVRKFVAIVLSAFLALGGLSLPDGALAEAAHGKPEIKVVDAPLPAGGLEEFQVIQVDDQEAEKVPSLGASSKKKSIAKKSAKSQETIFEQGTGDYGYNSLSKDQQSFYDRVSDSLAAFEGGSTNGEYTEINSTSGVFYAPFKCAFDDLNLDSNQATQVWLAYGADHPYLFWLENGCASSSKELIPLVRKDYLGDAATATKKREGMKEQIENAVKDYLKVADYYSLDYDKVREMDEMIIQAVDYAYEPGTKTPEDADWAHTIEGVFGTEHQTAVCEGYAKAFSFLLNILDIPNVYVTGDAGEAHAWNCVSFDHGDTYYYMDLTWDDQGADAELTGNSYQYFAMPKSKFEQKHHASTPAGTGGDWLYALPTMGDDMQYTYFMQYGSYGASHELSTNDDVKEFLSQTKALAPNRLSVYAMMLEDNNNGDIFQKIMQVMGLTTIGTIPVNEYGMHIWANPLTDYSKGQSHPLFNLDTKNLTINLASEQEKALGISSAANADGNYVRWHSDNNKVAVVKMPAYTKMEAGASVQIVAKEIGTATIRAEGSAGAMTCEVVVTDSQAMPTAEPTAAPTPTPTAEPTAVPTPTPTVEPTAVPTPGVNPSMSALPSASMDPGVSASPSVSTDPEVSASPSASAVPGVSASPSASTNPGTSTLPGVSEKPGTSERPGASTSPSASASPAPGVTQGPGLGTFTPKPVPTGTPKPVPTGTPKPAESQPGKTPSPSGSHQATKAPAKVKGVRLGGLYRDKKTKARYQVTGTGKTRTVTYQRSTGKSAKKVTIPASITLQGKTYRVTAIGNKAFAGNKKLREVSLGKNIKSIGKKAFYGCKRLKKVKIGKNVTAIRENAFRKCASLTLVIIPKKVKKIGENAFRDCKRLKYIGVETNSLLLKDVGRNAFAGGHGNPRVKTAKKVWRRYSDIFVLRGLSGRGLFVIDPVDLVI